MTSIERILDKGSSYTRFRIAIRVVRAALASAPEPVRSSELARVLDCSAWLLVRICANLEHTGILVRTEDVKDAWEPGPLAADVTLADILCSQIGDQAGRQEDPAPPQHIAPAGQRDMEAFLLQATISINQTVIEQLGRFPLRKPRGDLSAVRDA